MRSQGGVMTDGSCQEGKQPRGVSRLGSQQIRTRLGETGTCAAALVGWQNRIVRLKSCATRENIT